MITLIVLAACLFVIALLFGKRFGVPLLGLAAGLVIAQEYAATAVAVSAPYLDQYTAYVPAAIVLLPSLFLLIVVKGRHRAIVARVVNAATYAAAGLVFVIAGPLTPVSLSGSFPLITNNQALFIAGLLAVGLLEVAFGKPSKKKVEESKK